MWPIASCPFGTAFQVTGTAATQTSTMRCGASAAEAPTTCVISPAAAMATVDRARVRSASTPDPRLPDVLTRRSSRRDDHRSGHVAPVEEADVLERPCAREGHLLGPRQRHER